MLLLRRRQALHKLRGYLRGLTTTTAATTAPPPSYISLKSPVTTTTADPSLTLYFLKNSVGLSPSSALAVADKIHLKSTKKAHAVLSLLKSHGFAQPQIARLVSIRPSILLSDAHRTLKPKLDFYRSLGLSDTEIPRIISSNVALLSWSLDNRMIPNLTFLRSILPTEDSVIAAIKNAPFLLLFDINKLLIPKIESMAAHGVPAPIVAKLILSHSRALLRTNNFDRALDRVKGMAIDPASLMFAHAFGVLCKLTEPMWEEKMDAYKSVGWTEELVLKAFEKHPYCLSASAEKIKKNMEFFARKLGWSPVYVSGNPAILSLSFEKRIVPRYLVMKLLARKGLVKGDVYSNYMMIGEREFRDRYVKRFKGEVPEVVDAAAGKMSLDEFETTTDQKHNLDAV